MPRGANVQRAVQSMKSRNGATERRPVEDLGDRLEIVAAGGARGPHHAGRDACAERHAHEGAGFELESGGRAIAVGGVDGDRRQHVDHLRRRAAEVEFREGVVMESADEKAGGIAAGLACSRHGIRGRLYSLAAALAAAALEPGASTRSAMRADLPRRSRR